MIKDDNVEWQSARSSSEKEGTLVVTATRRFYSNFETSSDMRQARQNTYNDESGLLFSSYHPPSLPLESLPLLE